ncbi:FecR domain-containing protein [Paraflavisolibacter sp. H34]|uniref:FecR family protein n=1 Tax=Huijunlia imazamoxiresistens TaxID=3127457 RepID=UPI003017BE0B
MENRQEYDELLTKYLSGEADAVEEGLVTAWLEADEQNLQYFGELEKAWRLAKVRETVNRINVEEEWSRFEQTISGSKVVPMTESGYAYADEAPRGGRSRLYKIVVSVSVAASVLLVLGLGYRLLYPEQPAGGPVAKEDTVTKEAPLANVRHEWNATGTEKQIRLQDGSVIILAPASGVDFSEPFAPGRRDITLEGEARFRVAKNAARPFTVYSGDLSTTALGTEFTVTAFKKAPRISVRLFEGRVVVRSVPDARRQLRQDYFLAPGQELEYDTKTTTARVHGFARDAAKPGAAAESLSFDDPSVPENNKGSWYMFTNQSLGKTFDQLEMLFNVKIVYRPKDVRDIYFTGKYERSDSLEIILSDIAAMHHLTVKKKDSAYIISK